MEEHCSWLRRGSREEERGEERRGGAASFSSARVEDEGKRSDTLRRETRAGVRRKKGKWIERKRGRRRVGLTRKQDTRGSHTSRGAQKGPHDAGAALRIGAFIGLLRPFLGPSSKDVRRCPWLGGNERHLKPRTQRSRCLFGTWTSSRLAPSSSLSLLWDSTTGRKIHRAGFTCWEGNKEIWRRINFTHPSRILFNRHCSHYLW